MATRKLIKTVTGSRQVDGAGVHLVRVIGYSDTKDFDPFLMLDAFDSTNPDDYVKGFPWHPHRGIETVTYLISGRIEHEDSLGNKGVIKSGGCQWMTAGSGIMHQEMPKSSPRMLGFQLWINLPQQEKMTRPKYCDIQAEMVGIVEEEQATVKVISGEYKNGKGVQGEHVDALVIDVQVKPGASFSMPTNVAHNLFVYIFEGRGHFGGDDEKEIPYRTAVLFDKAEEFYVRAGAKAIRFALFAGQPLKESVAWGGPIVMNTRSELMQAFRELEEGTFIK